MSRSLKLRKKTVKTGTGVRHYACVRFQRKDHMMGPYGNGYCNRILFGAVIIIVSILRKRWSKRGVLPE